MNPPPDETRDYWARVEEILEAGADPKVTDLDGKTPMDLAGANNPGKKDVVVKMLQNAM